MGTGQDREWTTAEVEAAHARASAAESEFRRTAEALGQQLSRLDALELLSRVAFSMFFRLARLEAKPDTRGPEVFHLELLQAIALRGRNKAQSDDHPSHEVPAAIDLIKRNADAFRHLWLRKISLDAERNRREELISILQGWTLAVRGPRHPHQTREYVCALASFVDPTFRQVYGCSASDIVKALYSFHSLLEQRVDEYMQWIRGWFRKSSGIAMIDAFIATASPDDAEWIRKEALPHRYDRERLRDFFLDLAQDRYRAIFTFQLEDLPFELAPQDRAQVAQLLDTLAMGFGDLTDADLEHFHLANPVRLKPFIRLPDDRYFCCNPQSLITSVAEIFQSICERRASTKKRSEKFRGYWLEQKLRSVLQAGFPSAEIHHSVKWGGHSPDIEGGECDTVVLIDSTMLLFEAKSGKIDAPSRRGAFNSLRATLSDLVVAPSEQSDRFAQFVSSSAGRVVLDSKDGKLEFDADRIRNTVRINVLLDTVGPLSAHWPKLQAAGLLPDDFVAAPTMSVFELETVMEVLGLEVERCHYLSRRGDLERDIDYTADELDLLADYLEHQFNVGPSPGGERWIYGKSFKISAAYGQLDVQTAPNFQIKRTRYWGELLEALERLKPPGWTRFGHRLLNTGYEGQKRFEKLLREGEKQVRRADNHFFTSAITSIVEERRNTIAVCVGPRVGTEQFDSNLQHAVTSAADQGQVSDLLLVYRYWPRSGEPYDYMGTFHHAVL